MSETPSVSSIRHGTASSYSQGCRCDECRVAMVAYVREWRKRKREENPAYFRSQWAAQKARWRERSGKH